MVRVRFAPSPTGFLHIGNARAALLPWLFAKRHGGQFMLRFDDTDQERSKEIYAKAILDDMAWLGLSYDLFEKQSNRFDRYQQVMQNLIEKGDLYPCYETPEELEFKRKRQLSKGEPPIYDRAALSLTDAEKERYEKEGRKPYWRFKLKPAKIMWQDLIRGPVSFQGEYLSDPVLVRVDGIFLYTFASVVDDIDFDITHIVRGEDHVTNTAVQIQLFEAITQKPCAVTFAHFTLLMDKQGQALSKRLGSLSLQSMREKGISPMAINSLLARLGTSQQVEPALSLNELAEKFDFSIFSRNPPHFDEHDLEILTHKLWTITPYDMIKDRLPVTVTKSIWDVVKGNLQTLQDLDHWASVFSDDFKAPIKDDGIADQQKDLFEKALQTLPNETPYDETTWQKWMNDLKPLTSLRGKELFMPLRHTLTGTDHGPEMKFIVPLLGPSQTKQRLIKALEDLNGGA